MSGECGVHSGAFGRIQSIFFNDLRGKHLAPKAEVTGSNPVGCANDFNMLDAIFAVPKVACPQFVLRIRSRAVPGKIEKCSAAQGPNSPHDTPVTIK